MDKFKNKRAGHRGRVTTLTNSLNQELSKDTPFSNIVNMTVLELERQRDILQELDEKIAEELSDDTSSVAQDIDGSSEIMMQLQFAIQEGKQFIKSVTQKPNENRREAQFEDRSVKLPYLQLVSFFRRPIELARFLGAF